MRNLGLFFIAIGFCAFLPTDGLFVKPENWPKPVYDFTRNELSPEKVFLGRVLFYDTKLSANNSISCASCHSPFSAFTHGDHALSHGIMDSIGTRNAPSLMNLAWQKTFMWDGAINHLDMQALAPISHPAEMGSSIQQVVLALQSSTVYPRLFFNAWGDSAITGEKTLKSLSQFMLTLVSANSKYDRVMKQVETFSDQELNGYHLFQVHCASCHKEPLFTTGDFANNGLPLNQKLHDKGRMGITGNERDSLLFKIPTLRNIEYSFPYMHDGRFNQLSEVINHYTSGVQYSPTLSKELARPIDLTPNEKVDLIAFLLTLSEKEFVFNPQFQFPKEILLNKTKD